MDQKLKAELERFVNAKINENEDEARDAFSKYVILKTRSLMEKEEECDDEDMKDDDEKDDDKEDKDEDDKDSDKKDDKDEDKKDD